MKKPIKKCFAILLVITLTLTAAPLSGLVGLGEELFPAAKAGYSIPNRIELGSYPQNMVTNQSIVAELNALDKEWISYRYYSTEGAEYGTSEVGNMEPGDWMQYCDVELDGKKYRGVYISEYRPRTPAYPTNTASRQEDNGFLLNTVYWFEYAPLQWLVLDLATGLILCETIIDAQPFNNTCYAIDSATDFGYQELYYSDVLLQHYVNDYSASSIREWLNQDFYQTAFTEAEKEKIATTTLQNQAILSEEIQTEETIQDHIFLLTMQEASDFENDTNPYSREGTDLSDYAKSQGAFEAWRGSSPLGGAWGLRTAITEDNDTSGLYYVDPSGRIRRTGALDTETGVRPALCLDLTQLATDDASNAFMYQIEDGNTATLVKYDGQEENVVIPSSFGGYPLTKIGDSAFIRCNTIKTVTIPDTVTSIEDWAFGECEELTQVYLPRTLRSMGIGVFSESAKLESIALPPQLTSIPDRMAQGCDSLRSVTFSGTELTSIGNWAFSSCRSLVAIALPEGLKTLSDGAFIDCINLKRVLIPSTLQDVDRMAFYTGEQISEVYYPGTETEWDDIYFSLDNGNLTNAATIHFNYTGSAVDVLRPESFFQIFSTNTSNSVPVGEQMTFMLREYYNDNIVEDFSSCVISFAPEGIYRLVNTTTTTLGDTGDACYGITVQAEATGSTVMTVSDPNTGVYISVVLTATDAINVWRFNTVPVDTRYEENVNTNFYNYNRLCIANFDYTLVNEQPSEGEAKYWVSMDAYNANNHYAVAAVYDKNNELYDYALIAPHKEYETTFVDNVEEFLYLIGDTYHTIQNEYYYTGWSVSTYSRPELSVPDGGYIVITNNANNPLVFMANIVELAINVAFISAKAASGTVSSANTSEAVGFAIEEILMDLAEDGGSNFIEEYIENAAMSSLSTDNVHLLLDGFMSYLSAVDIDFDAILRETLDSFFSVTLVENAFYTIVKPVGVIVSGIFNVLDACNFAEQAASFANSISAPEIYIYQPLNDDKAYVTNGVNVIPENGVEEGYVAHSFIVGEDDTIILNAQTALDAISKNRVVYDVTLYQGGTATQPDGKIKVMLPIPEEFDRDRLTVYWVKENGELQSMHCYLEGEYICFETDHLSYYAILELNADSPSDIEPATSETDSPVTDPSTEPSTEPPVTEPTEPEYVLGDVNGDGRITSADARLALRAAVSLETLDAVQLLAADANGDGKVTSADARLILRVAVGLDAFEKKE